eukprot:CAMPEP_0181446024 /NCGR_PEP_ID=MMETSP1110-20121109/25892_1 /TAXON_ID=174948 /ORGANISM="Symbiodinium sp., Strain CCMP421" /LENGTH=400 /DNA_ID=CAMNT_0023570091 /DNA_START=87 /DNA_END=1289 /DNA_ORIENTATION=-
MAETPNRGAVLGSSTMAFPTRGVSLAQAGMQQMTPRGQPQPSLHTRGQFDDLEQKFKLWTSGSETGKSQLWKAWDNLDYNGNGIVSLAEIDRWIVECFPQLNNKPATMRAYKASDLNHDSYVTKREFPVLLRNAIFFNKVWSVFQGLDADGDRRLTFNEFRQGLSSLGMSSVVNPRSLFDSLDRNRGGLVLFEEFCRWVASVQCPVDASVYSTPTMAASPSSRTHHQKGAVYHSHSAKTQLENQFEVAEKKMHSLLKDKRQLQSLWRSMDYNGNGIVSLAEVDGCVTERFPEMNNKPALMRAYKATLRNPDGYVHKTDLQILLRNMFYFNKLYSLYEVVDTDNDRRMDMNEFRSGISFLGLKLTPSEAHDEFNFMDANGGGKVLFDEFCKWAAAKKLPID